MIAAPERLNLPYTDDVARATEHLYTRVSRTVTPAEWELFAPYIARIDALKAADPDNSLAIPVDLVTASGSGLDPHISPAAALYQTTRVARARGVDPVKLRQLVLAAVEPPQWWVFGEARVNVLMLNIALDRAQ